MTSEERGDYFRFGKMIAYFIVHKGPSPNFFSQLMYNIIAGISCYPQISDVFDQDVRDQLQLIQEAEDIRHVTITDSMVQTIDYVGGIPLLTQNKKEKLLSNLLEFLVITHMRGNLSQFLDGLSSLSALKAIREYPCTMSSLFLYQKTLHSSASQIEEMFKPVFSEEGSNSYIKELRTHSHWRDFLQDLEEKQDGLKNLLIFVTGLDEAPPLGYDPAPKLFFSHPNADDPCDGMPYANTCANSLTIPVIHKYDVFCERMNLSMSLGKLFTNA